MKLRGYATKLLNGEGTGIPEAVGVPDNSFSADFPVNEKRKASWFKPTVALIGATVFTLAGVRGGTWYRGMQAEKDQAQVEGQMLALSHNGLLPKEVVAIHIDPNDDIVTLDVKAKGRPACSTHVKIDPEGENITYSLHDIAGEEVTDPNGKGTTATDEASMHELIDRISAGEFDCRPK